KSLCIKNRENDLCLLPYGLPEYRISGGKPVVAVGEDSYTLQVFGRHNLLNVNGARMICQQLGVTSRLFFEAISSFTGASNRLERFYEKNSLTMFRDFAHAPSKLKATVQAVREFHPGQKIVACMELHTYSSLNRDFLDQYRDSMEDADKAFVFYSPHALTMKKLPDLDPGLVAAAFNKNGLKVFTSPDDLTEEIIKEAQKSTVFLFMSSGNFGQLDFKGLTRSVAEKSLQ
ncbi:MAG: cyanophycin synthetase, partial [Bacteroidales bacterium]